MKGILRFAALFAATAAIFCCGKPDNGDGGKTPTDPSLNQDLEFTLEVSETDATSAKIRVEHNGERNDTWYYFVTTESDIDQAILDEVEKLQKEGDVTLQRSTGKNITVKNLEAKTTYTFVVFGLSSEGEVYGTPADIEFTTKADITNLTESDEWAITYDGREDGKELFTINCAENSIYYFDIVDAYYVCNDNGEPEYLDDYMIMMVEDLQSLVDYGYTGKDFLELGILQTGPGTLSTARMISGYYFAFAIGYDADAVPTGTFSVELIEIEEEEATADYLKWVGVYEVKDVDNKAYTISIYPEDNNYMYAIVGWETGSWLEKPDGGMDFGTAFGDWTPAFGAYYDAATGDIQFTEFAMRQLTVTDETNTQHNTVLSIHGFAEIDDNLTLINARDEVISIAKTSDNGETGSVSGVDITLDGEVETTFFAMGYAAVSRDNTQGGVFLWNEPMYFPLSMTRLSDLPAEETQQSLSIAPAKSKGRFQAKESNLVAPVPATRFVR